jgi:quercetin dioxygenase-like cupin family protein
VVVASRRCFPALLLSLTAVTTAAQAPPTHVIVQPESLEWRGDKARVQTAIVEGNPATAGPLTMMLRFSDGAWIPPHFHNVDKRLIVVKGELLMGHGDVMDAAQTTATKEGGIAIVPANTRHYEGGRGETIVVLVAYGPFTTTMVRR